MNIKELSKISYPENKYKQTKFIVRALYYYRYLKHLYTSMNPRVANLIIQNHSEFYTKAMRPYMALALDKKVAMDMISQHHDWVEDNHLMAVYDSGLPIRDLTVGEDSYQFILSYEPRYWKEGELTLRLTDNIQNFYVISFTIYDGRAYVGGVQGPEHDGGFSKKITKGLFGLRPKSLILEVLRLWLKDKGINEILGVKNKKHTYSSIRYGNINFDFDSYWKEHGGQSLDVNFYQIPLSQSRKDLAALSRTKRKMYKKRYEFLDTLEV